VLDESPSADQLDNVREAVRVCPARAIHLDEG
jgi:ferredoxin